MRRCMLVFLAACGGSEPAKATTAPVTLDVPPMASSGAGMPSAPPADTAKLASDDPPAASAEPDAVPAATTVHRFPPPPPGSGPPGTQPFDKGAAASALSSVSIRTCSIPGGPAGPGHVTVTFAPDGSVAASVVDQGPFPGTTVGACLARAYRSISVPPFAGSTVRVGKSFVLP